MTIEELRGNTSERPIDDKAKVLEYLKSFEKTMFSSGKYLDPFSGEYTDDYEGGFTDGEYVWYVSEVHMFEKYNLRLNEDFVAKVLNHKN